VLLALGRGIGRMSVGFEELRRLITSHAPSLLMKTNAASWSASPHALFVYSRAIDRTSREAIHAI
jgi:hypothetical protein